MTGSTGGTNVSAEPSRLPGQSESASEVEGTRAALLYRPRQRPDDAAARRMAREILCFGSLRPKLQREAVPFVIRGEARNPVPPDTAGQIACPNPQVVAAYHGTPPRIRLPSMSETLETVRALAERRGLNLVAAVPVPRYDAAVRPEARSTRLAPRSRSIIAIGNGGGGFWKAFQRHARENPGWFERGNPLDDFTQVVIEREISPALSTAGVPHTVAYPFMGGSPTLDFMALGKAAGLGGASIIGVLVHPVFGPWIAFRAALLLEEELDAPGAAAGFDPCPRCAARPCVSACPASAVSYPAGWNVPRCLTHRVEHEAQCAPRCAARAACVLGPEHRYPDDELAYHQMRALRAMRQYYESNLRPMRSEGE